MYGITGLEHIHSNDTRTVDGPRSRQLQAPALGNGAAGNDDREARTFGQVTGKLVEQDFAAVCEFAGAARTALGRELGINLLARVKFAVPAALCRQDAIIFDK